MPEALRLDQLPSANCERQSGQAARAPEYQGKQGRAEWALRCLRRYILTCLLRSRIDRKPGIDALVVAAQRDLILGETRNSHWPADSNNSMRSSRYSRQSG